MDARSVNPPELRQIFETGLDALDDLEKPSRPHDDNSEARALRTLIEALQEITDRGLLMYLSRVQFPGPWQSRPSTVEIFEWVSQRLGQDLAALTEPEAEEPSTAPLPEQIPDQDIAPAQFHVVDGVIRIRPQLAVGIAEDEAIIRAAREELVDRAGQLIDALASSNCDERVTGLISQIQVRIESQQDIVRLGIAATELDILTPLLKEELADINFSKVRAFGSAIFDYLAQFPSWRRYLQNAAAAKLTALQKAQLEQESQELIRRMRREASIVEPEIPNLLETLLGLMSDVGDRAQQSVFAVISTLSNLAKSVFTYLEEGLDKARKGSLDGIGAGVKIVVSAAIVGLGIYAANVILPASSKLPNGGWIKPAIEQAKEFLKDK